jgi:glucan phosphoethanolaminetransferase (alkaline phosphatase superfamily)
LIEIPAFSLRQARKSTLVVAVALALIGARQLYRGRTESASAFAVAVAALFVCAAIPAAARWFHKWWMTLAAMLGYVNSRILLSAMFYLVLTPIGMVLRLLGHDALERRKGLAPSYWRTRAVTRQSRESYERSF